MQKNRRISDKSDSQLEHELNKLKYRFKNTLTYDERSRIIDIERELDMRRVERQFGVKP